MMIMNHEPQRTWKKATAHLKVCHSRISGLKRKTSKNPTSTSRFWLTFTWLSPTYKYIKNITQRNIILSFIYVVQPKSSRNLNAAA
jgi:hypothetical protein